MSRLSPSRLGAWCVTGVVRLIVGNVVTSFRSASVGGFSDAAGLFQRAGCGLSVGLLLLAVRAEGVHSQWIHTGRVPSDGAARTNKRRPGRKQVVS